MRLFSGILAASLVAGTAFAAQAQSLGEPVSIPTGWYMGAQWGANWLREQDLRTPAGDLSTDYDLGWGVLGQVGYDFGPLGFGRLRSEGELGWRQNGVDKLEGTSASGDINALSLMANLYYDIPTGTALTPYIGAGLGGVYVDVDGVSTPTLGPANHNSWKLGYQGIAGLAYALNENLSIKGDYRYFATEDVRFNVNGERVKLPYANHSVMVGFNWRFGAVQERPVEAAPAVAPAPAPAPAAPAPAPQVQQQRLPSSYMVFFDWDRSDITPEAREVIERAVQAAREGQTVRVELTGHADRSGPDAYNMRLSQRRAEAVKAVMEGLGVPGDAVGVVAKGESEPLVPTPDGVREPQNRRVEIVIP
ncbi:OmpA family protein [Telmatospirillum sp. J64-1]|uniref:OmpA family protein n=1 Tax=Telmatospirillum sp. J64-1 TaxID=2502183 RepID=UPI00163D7583|nr:OmpA family protein [Telmatospirillum sp. J64-1]